MATVAEIGVNIMAEEKTQILVRIDKQTKDDLKIYSIRKNKTLNELVVKYIKEGFAKDKEQDNK
jgi:predicted HicB family RNase H-like nuclease